MRKLLDKKLDRIADIWNHYIWEYRYCNSKIKFTADVKSNYFGDILKYFSDTFDLIFDTKSTEKFSDSIGSSIVLLQAIYVQQDFIEELLHIFKSEIVKGDLKKDNNYSINRALRNELIGHPIRKESINGARQLISSAIFTNSNSYKVISYIRYHIDNNYKYEIITHSRKEIVQRHSDFLNKYLDVILQKLRRILKLFRRKIAEIEKTIEHASFEKIIQVASDSFEYIFKTDFLFKPDLLLRAYDLRNRSSRYQNAVELFLRELKQHLYEKKMDIQIMISDSELNEFKLDTSGFTPEPSRIVIIDSANIKNNSKPTYHYEMGKLVSKEDIFKFRFNSASLRSAFKGNEILLAELDNMESNLDNDLEYYSSYHLVAKLIDEGI